VGRRNNRIGQFTQKCQPRHCMGCVVHLWDPTLQVQNLTTAKFTTFKPSE
jgi:hypothetical protein